jgi:hypothetical protein
MNPITSTHKYPEAPFDKRTECFLPEDLLKKIFNKLPPNQCLLVNKLFHRITLPRLGLMRTMFEKFIAVETKFALDRYDTIATIPMDPNNDPIILQKEMVDKILANPDEDTRILLDRALKLANKYLFTRPILIEISYERGVRYIYRDDNTSPVLLVLGSAILTFACIVINGNGKI